MKHPFKRSKFAPIMTDHELWKELYHNDALGYEDLPRYLRQELKARGVIFPSRNPTAEEMIETVQDAKEHRLYNNEMTLDDYKEKYHV